MSGDISMAIDIIARIEELFRTRGAVEYFGEPVTVAEHMLQTASLAEAEGAPDSLVVAALLHDIGHFLGGGGAYSADESEDKMHEAEGTAMLAPYFPPAVTDPVRLHVAAKRYLCATEPAYYARLSPASQHSLLLQGGPMNDAEISAFRGEPFYQDAVHMRRCDDSGKSPGVRTKGFGEFLPALRAVLAG